LDYNLKLIQSKVSHEKSDKNYNELKNRLDNPDEILVEQILYDKARVIQGVEALRKHEAIKFGNLMIESGNFSKTILKNTTKDIDAIVTQEIQKGNFARVHGGGYGGSVIVMTKEKGIKIREGVKLI